MSTDPEWLVDATYKAARASWSSMNPSGPSWLATSIENRHAVVNDARAAILSALPVITEAAARAIHQELNQLDRRRPLKADASCPTDFATDAEWCELVIRGFGLTVSR